MEHENKSADNVEFCFKCAQIFSSLTTGFGIMSFSIQTLFFNYISEMNNLALKQIEIKGVSLSDIISALHGTSYFMLNVGFLFLVMFVVCFALTMIFVFAVFYYRFNKKKNNNR